MFKMSDSGEQHADSQFVRLGDGICITNAAAWLYDGGHPVFRGQRHRIIKRQEAVGCEDEPGGKTHNPTLFYSTPWQPSVYSVFLILFLFPRGVHCVIF